jgi:hypothetical protein
MVMIMNSNSTDQLYPPSWFDRFKAWLGGLPGPVSAYYLVAGVLSIAIFVSIQATQGAYTDRGFYPWHVFLALQPVIVLSWMHYLDAAAISALERYKPAMKSEEQVLAAVRYRMTILPARPALIATFIGVLIYFVLFGPQSSTATLSDFRLSPSTVSSIMVAFTFLMMWAFLGLAIYNTVQQIAVIRELFARHTQADLYNREPLYAFSGITGRTALVLILNSYGWIWGLNQGGAFETDPVSALGVNIFFAAFSLFIFAWPLWGAHQLLVDAKRDALATNAALMRTTIEELHRGVERKKVEAMDDWHKALAALDLERTRLEQLPTWPWRPEALRGLIAALIVPILVWVVQYLLERILG